MKTRSLFIGMLLLLVLMGSIVTTNIFLTYRNRPVKSFGCT